MPLRRYIRTFSLAHVRQASNGPWATETIRAHGRLSVITSVRNPLEPCSAASAKDIAESILDPYAVAEYVFGPGLGRAIPADTLK
ncbi:unnamed protein product [Fusarium graminearum]|uniref:Chromosome 1, complete genome n=1 Tax=Gibberella zeae (strain ATCC MYA-4620 / CBS 123657 / FGSC 9075 / NRRL 31084 / PH-1) TaxID=229533 RepID=A0A0E0RWC6_GIBZE|nr:hypothetical protein FG05_30389 [Fusarium graminearum]CEF75551.1 unnamed protein product [Fusarium graminearum]CZS78830.1 unnamed protein product [Fusarium graminearum]